MTTYVCRPSRNRYVSSAIFLSFNIRAPPCPPLRRRAASRRRGFTARARRRPFTGFLYYGPFGLSYLLTIHFVWTYMGTLEKLQFAEPWDFLVMLLFGAASLLAGVGIGGGNARFLGHNLSCFLVYIWARTYEGQEVAVMEFFTIRAELWRSVWKSLRGTPSRRQPDAIEQMQ